MARGGLLEFNGRLKVGRVFNRAHVIYVCYLKNCCVKVLYWLICALRVELQTKYREDSVLLVRVV